MQQMGEAPPLPHSKQREPGPWDSLRRRNHCVQARRTGRRDGGAAPCGGEATVARSVHFIKVMADSLPPSEPRMEAPVLKAVVAAAHRRSHKVFARRDSPEPAQQGRTQHRAIAGAGRVRDRAVGKRACMAGQRTRAACRRSAAAHHAGCLSIVREPDVE